MVVSDPGASPAHARAAVEAVWRIEAPRLIGALARPTGDLGLAEELASDAFAAALEQWPTQGVPQRPGAWLLTTGRRRGIDVLRRARPLRPNGRYPIRRTWTRHRILRAGWLGCLQDGQQGAPALARRGHLSWSMRTRRRSSTRLTKSSSSAVALETMRLSSDGTSWM